MKVKKVIPGSSGYYKENKNGIIPELRPNNEKEAVMQRVREKAFQQRNKQPQDENELGEKNEAEEKKQADR